MRRCVSERELVLMRYGEGSEAARAHVRACLGCAARSQRLERDLRAIGGALLEPPAGAGRHRSAGARRWGLGLAAGLAALVVLGGTEAWMWRASQRLGPPDPGAEAEVVAFLEEASAVLSSVGDAGGDRVVGLADPVQTDAGSALDDPLSDE